MRGRSLCKTVSAKARASRISPFRGKSRIAPTALVATQTILLTPLAGVSAQDYGDSYPKHPDVDMLGYVFELTFSDDSDVFQGRTTAAARFLTAGHQELRLDLIERSDALDGRGMTVSGVEAGGVPLSWRHENDQIFTSAGPVGRSSPGNEALRAGSRRSGRR